MSIDTQQRLAIQVNGQPRRVSAGVSVSEMLTELGIDPLKVAVERNRDVVPRSSLPQVIVEDGDRFEIVHFVGGG
jgi:thiazole synthase